MGCSGSFFLCRCHLSCEYNISSVVSVVRFLFGHFTKPTSPTLVHSDHAQEVARVTLDQIACPHPKMNDLVVTRVL